MVKKLLSSQESRRQNHHNNHTKGYQAMGSFHSENVDDLMAKNDDNYEVPKLPFDSSLNQSTGTSDFLLDRDNWTFLNHGAFGGALSVGYNRAQQWRLHLERQPLRYFDRDLLPHLVYSARRMANFCNADREAITLIPNVTYGLTTVLQGYKREFGHDKKTSQIILWDTSYGSLKKIARACCDNVTEIPLSKYFDQFWSATDTNQVFERALMDTLEQIDNPNNALLVLDHTTSNTALNMPLNQLSKIAREHNMLVMVDGAHGLLAQPVSLRDLDIDFYLANGHKWLSCPRGIGVLYCPNENLRETILRLPAVLSHGIGQGYQSRFLWDGCRDYAAALSVPAVLDYWEQDQNVVKVQQQIKEKRDQAVGILCNLWNQPVLNRTLVPMDVHSPMMVLVRLPENAQKKF